MPQGSPNRDRTGTLAAETPDLRENLGNQPLLGSIAARCGEKELGGNFSPDRIPKSSRRGTIPGHIQAAARATFRPAELSTDPTGALRHNADPR